MDRTPFTIGTEESRLEVLKLKVVEEMAERELGVATGPKDAEESVENNTVGYREILRAVGDSGGLDNWEDNQNEESEEEEDRNEEDDGSGGEGEGDDGYVGMDEGTSSYIATTHTIYSTMDVT